MPSYLNGEYPGGKFSSGRPQRLRTSVKPPFVFLRVRTSRNNSKVDLGGISILSSILAESNNLQTVEAEQKPTNGYRHSMYMGEDIAYRQLESLHAPISKALLTRVELASLCMQTMDGIQPDFQLTQRRSPATASSRPSMPAG